jgi:hypothetical protein
MWSCGATPGGAAQTGTASISIRQDRKALSSKTVEAANPVEVVNNDVTILMI